MRQKAGKCEKGKNPKTCTPRQIEECHGTRAKHPCAPGTAKKAK